ncbi:MAG: DNA gyrase inhibitor YacG [bacterium]
MPKTVKCPLCRQEISWENNPFRPFCSERCKIRDLGHWASGDYAVPGESASPPETDGEPPVVPSSKKEPPTSH